MSCIEQYTVCIMSSTILFEERGRHGCLELGESEVIVEGLEKCCCLYLVLLNHNMFRTLSQFVVKWTE